MTDDMNSSGSFTYKMCDRQILTMSWPKGGSQKTSKTRFGSTHGDFVPRTSHRSQAMKFKGRTTIRELPDNQFHPLRQTLNGNSDPRHLKVDEREANKSAI
jgi:hypothetical protein